MANSLLIEKQTGGYFKFTLNGDTANAITSIQNDLLAVGNQLHFKTGNGANIIKEQFIYPEDVTIVSGGTFTFTTVAQVWDKLIDIDYFAWLGGGGGIGIDRFDDLVDTFKYTGNAGKTVIVDNSELRLVPVTLYNKRLFTELEDTPSALVPNKMVVVNSAGDALIFKDQPEAPETLLNSVGYFDYNDLITQTVPLNAVSNVALKLTNDSEGANTSTDQNPYGVSYVWDYTTNQFNFSELSVGDTIDVRIHLQVTTTSANQRVLLSAKLGIGSIAEFTNIIYENQFKSAGLHEINFVAPFYIGSTYISDNPAELYLTTDASATVKVDGWYVRIIRKDINIITVDYTVPDATTLAKGIVRLAGDLGGTANNPTVPGLANKVSTSRTIGTTSPLLGGGALTSDLILSIQQANSTQSGFISYVDWANFEAKQSALSGSGFVKVSGSTVSYDNNVYSLDSDVVKLTGNQTIEGIKTFTDYTKFTDYSATGGLWAVEIDVNSNDALVVKDGGTVRFQIGRNGETLGQKYKVSGGFSNQFLKANGDLDSNTYALDSEVVKLTGNQTIAGQKTFANTIYAIGGTGSGEYAIEIDKSFEGEAIRVKNSTSTTFTLSLGGTVTASSYVKSGGTSSQFLKADGSVDSSTYLTSLSGAVLTTTDQTVAGSKTFTSDVKSTAFRLTGGTSGTGLYYGHTNKVVLANYTVGGGIDFETNGGSLSMILNSNGNLGIGVDPSAWDTVWKVLQISKGSYYASDYSNIMAHNLYVAGEDTKYISSNRASQYEQNSGNHYWYTAPTGTAGANVTLTPRMTLDNSGKLGIGITTPSEILDIRGSSLPTIKIRNNTAGSGNYSQLLFEVANTFSGTSSCYIRSTSTNTGNSSADLSFGVNANGGGAPFEAMRITSGGNVGIGTTSPSSKLTINGRTDFWSSEYGWIHFDSSSTNQYLASIKGSDTFMLTTGKNGANTQPALLFGTSDVERMRITSGGNVGIGTSSPGVSLEVNGLIRSIPVYNNTTATAANLVVSAGGTFERSTSSLKYKKEVRDYDKGLETLLQIRPVYYKGKAESDGDKQFAGLIAEEIHELGLTEFVQYAEDETPDALAYTHMIALLVKAIQEQNVMLQELKAEIEILKNK